MISYRSQKRLAYFLFFCFAITAIILLEADKRNIASLAEGNNDRQLLSIKITESLKCSLPIGARNLRIWIPLPATERYQVVESLKIKSSWSYKIIKDPDFNNEILFIDLNDSPEKKSQAIIKWEYKIVRSEQSGFSKENNNNTLSDELYLKERGLVIIDDRIRNIVRKVTDNISDPLEKARAIYHYVLTHVDYDISVPGWGKGDVPYACNVGKGIVQTSILYLFHYHVPLEYLHDFKSGILFLLRNEAVGFLSHIIAGQSFLLREKDGLP